MLKNYLKTTLRTLLREKTSTSVNIAGLTFGVTCCLILFLILRDGASYDKHHSNYERIYRVVSQSQENGREAYTQGIAPALPDAFKEDFPEAEAVAFTSYRRSSLVGVQQPDGTYKKYEEPKGLVITEPSFFRIFDRKLLIGDSQKGLDDPNEAIISQKWAIRYFGKEEGAVGKIVRYDDRDYTITGVMEDYPATTDLPFDLMLSYITVKKGFDETGWGSVSDQDNCYFLLKVGEDIGQIRSRVPAFIKKHIGSEGADKKNFIIQPLKDLHSDGRFSNYNKRMPQEAKVAFIVIGIFLLLMACINFINLTTAEAVRRTKEVGIRKILGSTSFQLLVKFTGETFIVTVISVMAALALTEMLLVRINTFLDLSLALNLGSDLRIWIFLVSVILAVSLFSGLYPAYVMSRFRPVQVVKGQTGVANNSGFNLRRSLVVAQFFISQLFIIGTIVVLRQMEFMDNHYLGFQKDAIMTVPIPERGDVAASSRMRALKDEILRLSEVGGATLSNAPPSSAMVLSSGFKVLENGEELSTQVKQVDGDYLTVFDIEVVAGQDLADLDTMTGFVVNEKFVETAGYESNEAIIGKEIDFWGKRLPVKGVVGNFSTRSLEKPIEPVILTNDIGGYSNLSIRLASDDMQASIEKIQALWRNAYPEYIFKYTFMDEQIRNLYRGERKMSAMISVFASVAVFIGCLGLFGLISFMANQKTKEVGIRKVLGASVGNIVLLFSREFVKLILIGFALAAPLAGFVMDKFLQEYTFSIRLGPAIYLMALGIAFLVALVTVGIRSFRAASANPVQSLRSE